MSSEQKRDKTPSFVTTGESEDSSLLHHRRIMQKLDWVHQPTSVALFIQENIPDNTALLCQMKTYLTDELHLKISYDEYIDEDFIILVGADGSHCTISSLFQDRDTPPVLSLAPQGKGFLSYLELAFFDTYISQVVRGNCWILPRVRLLVEYHSHLGVKRNVVLNDLVVNRGSTQGSLMINCSCNGFGFSQIIGDGIIIATPTGSTAYNKGAGGALVHPLLPVFLLTPICALSLSARPILFPQSANLSISLENTTKTKRGSQNGFISFDGGCHIPFNIGETLVISVSPHPFNSVMANQSISEWPVRLAALMGWNERKHQKVLPTTKGGKL